VSGEPANTNHLAGRDWFGQPRGLTILFLTEMWDQFSFFGMRALLVLYMTKHLLMAQQNASWVYGLYAASVYLTPVFGGMITDRWLTRRTAVLTGATIMMIGHFLMASEGLFYWALGTIALGNGLFLPSLASQIDDLYVADDPRRRSAYNIYYVGINLGAFAAPLVIGTVGEVFGFHWGFALAGLGMIVAIATYVAGGRYLPAAVPKTSRTKPTETARDRPTPLKTRLVLLVVVAAAVVVFRGAYEQLGNTIPLWADAKVDRTVTTGLTIPVTWFQSLNPMTVFLLTPAFVAGWTRQAKRGREPSSAAKMALGAAVIGLAFLLIAVVGAYAQARAGITPWPLLAAFIVLLTAGELFILPVGLGLFGRLAPAGLTATTIALWYSAGFFGNLFAGWLGTLWSTLSVGTFFALTAAIALASAALLGCLIPWVRETERSA